jgi:Ca2+-binding EF-hand superfamily protein
VWAAGRALAGPLATAITVASLPEPVRGRLGLPEFPGAHTLMHTAYLSTELATRLLPQTWTRLETVMTMFDPAYAPRSNGDRDGDSDGGPGGGLRRRAAKAGALLRLLTPAPRTASAAHGPTRESASRFFSEVLDQTGNGSIDWPDIAAMAREIATRLDLDRQEEDRLFTAFAEWWRELCSTLDDDGDGRVTAQEYAAAAATMSSPALIRVAEVLFDATDTDDDQAVDGQEYRALFRTAFDHDPGGGDERLSRSTFVRQFLAFMAGRQHSDAYERLLAQS